MLMAASSINPAFTYVIASSCTCNGRLYTSPPPAHHRQSADYDSSIMNFIAAKPIKILAR
jgi:hypothetical protein